MPLLKIFHPLYYISSMPLPSKNTNGWTFFHPLCAIIFNFSIYYMLLPSLSFWRQWHRGDEKFKIMALRRCANFQWHIKGWVTFFNGIQEIFSKRYSTQCFSLLLPSITDAITMDDGGSSRVIAPGLQKGGFLIFSLCWLFYHASLLVTWQPIKFYLSLF